MSTTVILLIAALIVTFLVFTWLIKVVKATLQTALTIAIIVLILQLIFGIGPTQLWQKIIELPQLIWQQPNQ
ncbi:hypothetical protein ACE1B6_27825 [Aerosakkonemataceae cyanobacterium BLCC-F154]|uniref:Uncharacterized protein n=1 Tax=Floridaenema fluviatile BLCC-F154 TaxID=3153640 RepID=A0ABV4YJR1_9CYAN